MDKKQSANKGNLEFLLQYLACPADGISDLRIIRNADDQAIALRSQNREYPVIDNIPNMMPGNEVKLDPAWRKWEALLGKWIKAFSSQTGPELSEERDPVAGYIAGIIASSEVPLILDIGCGTTAWTPYMEACGEEVSWIGIDPLIGHQTRRYPFVQGIGEYLPFRSSVFNATLYSLVLSNMLDPHLSMQQAHRVMKPGGKLYIRYFTARIDPRYLIWKMLNSLGILWPYNQFYRWVFTNQSLQHLLRGTGFELAERVLLCDVCPISQQCPDAGSEYFVTGRRV